MALTRSQLASLLTPGLNKVMGDSYKLYADDKQYTAIYGSAQKATKAYEENIMLATLGPAQLKNEGGAMALDEGAEEMWRSRITMQTYGLRFNITKEAIDDNQYMNPAKTLASAMGKSMAERKNLEAFAPLNNATVATGIYQGGDGKALAATDHPTKDGGVNSNLLTAADFNEASLEDMLLLIQNWVTQRGIKLKANLTKLILPIGYTFIAARLEKSMGRVGTADNDANIHKGFAFISGGYTISNYLSDPDAWGGITDVQNGLTWFDRQKIETYTNTDFATQNIQYGCTERYGFGFYDPLGYVHCAGA